MMEVDSPELTSRFVLAPSMRVIGWFAVAFWGCGFVATLVSAAGSPEIGEHVLAWMYCVVWVANVLFLGWCVQHSLEIGAEYIENRGLFRSKRMQVPQIISVKWRLGKSSVRGVVLRDGTGRLAIDFTNYGLARRLALTMAIRRAIPITAVQSGWDDEFVKPLPNRYDARSLRRIFRFTCFASGVGWICFMAIWIWLKKIEPEVPVLSYVIWSSVACGCLPAIIASICWLARLDEREANRETSNTAPAARAGDDARR